MISFILVEIRAGDVLPPSDQAVSHGEGNSLEPAPDVELGEDAVDVILHGGRANGELLSDGFVRGARGEKAEYPLLTMGKAIRRRRIGGANQ
jgi:hypothetical protein